MNDWNCKNLCMDAGSTEIQSLVAPQATYTWLQPRPIFRKSHNLEENVGLFF